MGSIPSRREYLSSISSVLLIGVAGCASAPGKSATPNGTREDRLCAENVSPPPSGADDDRIIVREYPDLPDDLTEKSAERYATSFEEAYQMNRLAEQSSARNYEVKSVINARSNEVENGFIVAFEMSLSWEKESSGMTVSADDTVAVTYFVSDRTVIRHGESTDVDPREDGVGEIQLCRVPNATG